MMLVPGHDFWGCARGPVVRLAPQTRILAGVVLFSACLTAPARTFLGAAFIPAVALYWIGVCGMPKRAAKSMIFLGLAMFLPYFFLVPLLVSGQAGISEVSAWARAFAAPWDVFLHGLAGMFVATATAATLSASDLREGLVSLPVPRVFAAILIQIVHQASELQFETRRVAAALSVRGATSGGRTALRVLTSLPRIWLPRIIAHADRVAAAMELRGYAESDPRTFGRRAIRVPDVGSIFAVLGVLALAVALRCWWIT
jgi:energy-coupling factor transporter transmembrane protein EcfT